MISFFATVGNYDYGFYWYLYQDGTIQLEAKLTGIIQTSAVAPGKPYPWGGMVGEGLAGPTHQHIFNVRLHMMVDGEKNSITEHEFVPRPWGNDNPYGNVFDTTSRTLTRERDAAREADGRTGRYWKVTNPNKKNVVGNAPGYKLVVNPSPLMLAQEGSAVRARAQFATKHVWVTQYDPAERYASGQFPEPARRRRRPAEVHRRQPQHRERGHRALAHLRAHPRLQARGHAGHGGGIRGLHAEAERLLRRQPRDGSAARQERGEPTRADDPERRRRVAAIERRSAQFMQRASSASMNERSQRARAHRLHGGFLLGALRQRLLDHRFGEAGAKATSRPGRRRRCRRD